jgi:3-deoxy-D-manno-octulosonic acid kinase
MTIPTVLPLSPRTLPPDFVIREIGQATLVIRREWEEPLISSGILTDQPGSSAIQETPIPGGRESASIVTVAAVGKLVVRRYRRGGLIGKILVDRYLSASRPFRELAVLSLAGARGVPVPEVLGASSTRAGLFRHRGRIVTRLVPESRTLPAFIREKRDESRRVEDVLKKAGAAIKAMHDAGIYHADLNMNNILVTDQGRIVLIDFDNARTLDGMSAARRAANLRRLLRSLRKLRESGSPLEDGEFSMIIEGYADKDVALAGALRTMTLGSRSLMLRSALSRTIRRIFPGA